MEGFSIVAGVFGLLSAITTLSIRLDEFRTTYTEAVSEIDTLNQELNDLSTILKRLHEAEETFAVSNLAQDLHGVLENCNRTVVATDILLQKAYSRRLRGLYWAFSGKRECMQLCRGLEAHKSTINIAVTLTSLTGTHQVQNGIDHIISKIHRIRSDIPSRGQDHDQNFILRRFLEDAESYVETIHEASTAVGDTANDDTEAENQYYQGSLEGTGSPQHRMSSEGISQRALEDRSRRPQKSVQENQNQDDRIPHTAQEQQKVRPTDTTTIPVNAEHSAPQSLFQQQLEHRDDISAGRNSEQDVSSPAATTTLLSNKSTNSSTETASVAHPQQPEIQQQPELGALIANLDLKREAGPCVETTELAANRAGGNTVDGGPQMQPHQTDLLSYWKSNGQGHLLYSFQSPYEYTARYPRVSFDGKYLVTLHYRTELSQFPQNCEVTVMNLHTGIQRVCNIHLGEKRADFDIGEKRPNFDIHQILDNGVSATYLTLLIGDKHKNHNLIQFELDNLPPTPDEPTHIFPLRGSFDCTTFSADGELFASGYTRGINKFHLRVYNVSIGHILLDVYISTPGISSSIKWRMWFNNEKTAIMAYSASFNMLLLDARTGHRLPEADFYTRATTFSPDFSKSAEIGDKRITILDLKASPWHNWLCYVFPLEQEIVAEFLPKGNLMLVHCAGSEKMYLIDTKTKSIHKTWDGTVGSHSLMANPRGSHFLEVSVDGRTVVLVYRGGLWIWTPFGHWIPQG
jgi:hypothetical protein